MRQLVHEGQCVILDLIVRQNCAMLLLFLLPVVSGGACTSEVREGTIEAGYVWLARCIDSGKGEEVYRALDQKSQWSVQTIYKLVGQMRRLVEKDYAPEKKKGALGMWEGVGRSASNAEAFAVLLSTMGDIEGLKKGFSAPKRVHTSGDEGYVTAISGRRFEFSRGKDGRWGLSIYRKKLDALKIRAQDHLELIRQNALAFEEARRGEGKNGPSD